MCWLCKTGKSIKFQTKRFLMVMIPPFTLALETTTTSVYTSPTSIGDLLSLYLSIVTKFCPSIPLKSQRNRKVTQKEVKSKDEWKTRNRFGTIGEYKFKSDIVWYKWHPFSLPCFFLLLSSWLISMSKHSKCYYFLFDWRKKNWKGNGETEKYFYYQLFPGVFYKQLHACK